MNLIFEVGRSNDKPCPNNREWIIRTVNSVYLFRIDKSLQVYSETTSPSSIYQNWHPDIYRNPFLAQAMFNLNMIDTIGGGIRRMFQRQKQRFFPLPDYDLSHSERVNVEISGKVLDENYTQMLSSKIDLDLDTVILLDKVQKGIKITPEGHRHLRKQKLTEGRYPNIYISAHLASIIEEKAKYIKYRGLN